MSELSRKLNEMERRYFFERTIGEASGTGYIGSNTWRGWRASPKIENAPKNALVAAFDFLTQRFERFISQNPTPSRMDFDEFHKGEVDALFEFLQSFHSNTRIHPAAEGRYHEFAYNVYAKVVNLAYSHWCFRPQPVTGNIKYNPVKNPHLLHCFHVPLDTKVNRGIKEGIKSKLFPSPRTDIPSGGMGSIKSKHHYDEIQNYLRSIADQIPSDNFKGLSVSPLAFEAFW